MSEPFLGEIKIVSWSNAPQGWASCNGQFLPINQNQALFALLGTMYGGNGQTTFALPDFRGKVPVHVGAGFIQGQAGGQQAHTLTTSEMPQHFHVLNGSSANANNFSPANNPVYAKANQVLYAPPSSLEAMNPGCVSNTGGSQPHINMQPYLVLHFIIALQGIFPSRN